MGVQETRIQGNCRLCTGHYDIISSGANPEGTQGVQIWISTDVAARLLSEMQVSPRLLVSVVVICRQVFVLVVGHVPDSGSAESSSDFYNLLEESFHEVMQKYPLAIPICMIDANGRIGDYPSNGVGPFHPDAEDDNGI